MPPGAGHPEACRQRSGGLLLDKARRSEWFELTRDARRAFVDNPPEAIRASYQR